MSTHESAWILEATERGKDHDWADSARHKNLYLQSDRHAWLKQCESIEPDLVYRWRNVNTGAIERLGFEDSLLVTSHEQPAPHGTGREILPLVIADLVKRSECGITKYGEPLKANNGRSALRDAYEELLDMCQYLRQAIEESEGK